MGRFSFAATWSFILVATAATSSMEQCAGGAAGSCKVAQGEAYLQTTQHMKTMRSQDAAARVFDDSEDILHVQRGSCLDSLAPDKEIPNDLNQNYLAPDVDYACVYDVSWEHSDWMLAAFQQFKADKEDYKFKVCYDSHQDPEVRQFPWVQSAGGDWRYNLSRSGSVILSPQDQVNTWANGFQNVMPDALEFYCRMGEVAGRKIIPRFMIFGWSKGGTYLWPLGRWRQDLVQASILVHGCDSKFSRWTEDLPKKSKSDGVGPTLFISSRLDTYSKCTYSDTKKQHSNQRKVQPRTYYVESPCGHHPENCWPVCDYLHTYVEEFWGFVEEVLPLRQTCTEDTDQAKCESHLGVWDETEGFCEEAFPSRLSRFCERFCLKSEVDSCAALDEATCSMSYRLLATEEAQANGMFSACEFVDGACVDSPSSYQCFFQDQCP